MYVGTADLRYLARYNVNRGLGDITPKTFITPVVPYRELSSAPLRLVRQQQGLAGLEGFFSTSKKWRKRRDLMMRDVKLLEWWGYKFTTEDKLYIQSVEYKAAKEQAKRSGFDRIVKDVALPVFMTIATAGAATPLALGMAAGSAAVGAVQVRKFEKKALKMADESFAVGQQVLRTEGELEEIQKEIAEMQRQSGIPKPVINKAIQNAANQQDQQKKTLSTILVAGAAIGVAAMAA